MLDGDYSDEAFVRTIATLTEHLGLTRFVLGGHSMGGGVALRHAMGHSEQIRAMILVDASGLPNRQANQEQETQTPFAFRLLRQDWFIAMARYLEPGYMIAQGLRASFHDGSLVNERMIARYRELTLRAGSRDAVLRRIAGYAQEYSLTELDLAKLTQPTLILWGADDQLIPLAVAHGFAAALSGSTLIVYADVGHLPMEEVPDRSAEDVRQFLVKLPR